MVYTLQHYRAGLLAHLPTSFAVGIASTLSILSECISPIHVDSEKELNMCAVEVLKQT